MVVGWIVAKARAGAISKSTQHEVLKCFLHHSFTFPECISALDSALAALIPNLKPSQLPDLGAVMLANNDRVMKEMEKRENQRKANAKARAAKNRYVRERQNLRQANEAFSLRVE